MGAMPGSVRIVFFDDGRLLLDDFRFGTGARHGRTEEHVDDEHNQEEDTEGDAKVEEPKRLNPGARRYRHCKTSVTHYQSKRSNS